MKSWILTAALIAGCSDAQNLGDRFSFHSARWSVSIGPEAGFAKATGVAVDGADSVVAIGLFQHTVDFGDTVVDAGDTGASFVTKRNGLDGSELWTRTMTGGNLEITAVATDAHRSVIIVGRYGISHDFDGVVLHTSLTDVFVVKYDENGQLLWATGLGAIGDASADAITVTPSGRVYVTARTSGVFRGDQGDVPGPYVLAALETDGTIAWIRSLPVGGRVAVTRDGGVMLAGVADQSTTLGATPIDLTRDGDCFAAKFSPTGSLQWVRTFGDPGVVHGAPRLAVDDADHAAVAVNIVQPHPGAPSEALVGNDGVLWTAQPRNGIGLDLAVATSGDVVVTAGYIPDRTIDLGSGALVGTMYLTARDATGALIDARVYGDPSLGTGDAIEALSRGPSGELAFAGYVDQPIDLGTGELAAPADGVTNIMIGVLDAP